MPNINPPRGWPRGYPVCVCFSQSIGKNAKPLVGFPTGRIYSTKHGWLVVWNIFYISIYWEYIHPNWRTPIFQRVQPTRWGFHCHVWNGKGLGGSSMIQPQTCFRSPWIDVFQPRRRPRVQHVRVEAFCPCWSAWRKRVRAENCWDLERTSQNAQITGWGLSWIVQKWYPQIQMIMFWRVTMFEVQPWRNRKIDHATPLYLAIFPSYLECFKQPCINMYHYLVNVVNQHHQDDLYKIYYIIHIYIYIYIHTYIYIYILYIYQSCHQHHQHHQCCHICLRPGRSRSPRPCTISTFGFGYELVGEPARMGAPLGGSETLDISRWNMNNVDIAIINHPNFWWFIQAIKMVMNGGWFIIAIPRLDVIETLIGNYNLGMWIWLETLGWCRYTRISWEHIL